MATIVTRGGKGSPLTNNEVDNNFINLNTELAGKATLSSLATVATTGSYSDLVGSPTNISSFTNDAGYITSSGSITGNADTATQLATARTISLAGDVTGSATFDGSANITITAAVADDSHAHIIGNIDGLQAALNGKAALGANSDITSMAGITGGISTPDYIDFDTAATPARATGRLWWDNADGISTLNLGMAGSDVTLQVGQETHFRIKASSAITNGQVVMLTGTVGASGALTGAPASGITADTGSYIMGVATESIALNGWGYVTQFGLVRNVDTSGGTEAWTDGQILYYDPTVSGGLTKNVPDAPNAKVEVAAVVYAHATNGSLFVRVAANPSLEQLSDVETSAASNTDLLQYNGTAGRWEHKSPTLITTGNADKLTTARTITLSGDVSGSTSFDGSANVTINAVVADDSHNHIISNVDGLQAALDGKEPTITILPVSKGGTGATSLTSGYVLKGNGTSPVTSSVIYDNGTNVGIGTTSPNGLLELNGGTGVVTSGGTLVVRQRGDTNADGIAVTSSNATSHRIWKDAAGALNIGPSGLSSALVQNLSGKVGIGTSSPDYTLDVAGTLAFDGSPATLIRAGGYPSADVTLLRVSANNRDLDSADYGFSIKYMGTRSGVNNSLSIFADNQVSSAIEAVTILQDGNVGIGTISPSQTLQVQGTGYATSDFRAPIFYDSDNTSRYVDPAGFSLINVLQVADNIQSVGPIYASGSYLVLNTAQNSWNNVIQRNNGDDWIVYGGDSVRAPRFYDSNNTAYYVDPNSTSELTTIQLRNGTGLRTFSNGSSSINSQLYFADAGNTRAWNWQLDENNDAALWNYNGSAWSKRVTVTTGSEIFLRNSFGNDLSLAYPSVFGYSSAYRTTVIGNQAYNTVCIGVSPASNPSGSFNGTGEGREVMFRNGVNFITPNSANNSYLNPLNMTDGYVSSSGSFRAPIFYDSNNTGYYVDPNSTSLFNSVGVDSLLNLSSGAPLFISSASAAYQRVDGRNDGSDARAHWYGVTTAGATSNFRHAWYDGSDYFNVTASGGQIYFERSGGATINATGDFRAPIFYDSNNTAYYVDPANTGFTMVGGTSSRVSFYTADSGYMVGNAEGSGATVRLGAAWGLPGSYSNSSYTVGAESDIQFVISGTTKALIDSGANLSLGVSGFGSGVTRSLYIGDTNGGISSTFGSPTKVFGFHGVTFAAQGTTLGTFASSGILNVTTGVSAPVFTDSANSAYYVDPAGTTSLRTVGDWRSDSSAWTGEFAGKIQYHNNSWYLQAANSLIFRNAAGSVEPFYVTQGGVAVAAGDMRAPIFYDLDNTGYYVDPNYISQFWRINAADYIYTSSDVYGRRFIDIDNQSYFIDGASESSLNTLRTAGTVVVAGNFSNNAYNSATGARLCFGGADGDAQANYYIGTNIENYGGSYNKLDIRWHTGIRMGAHPSYGGIRFYDTEDLGTQVFAIGKDGSYAQANQSMRAPIFYDLDNTAYYVDPNGVTSASFASTVQFANTTQSKLNLYGSGYQIGIQNSTEYYRSDGRFSWFRGGVHSNSENDPGTGGTVAMTLDSSSNLTVTGNVTAYSDIRVKDNVKQIEGALDKVQAIRGVTYNRTDLEDTERRYGGVIAQEIEKVLPEAIFENDDRKAVDYNATIGLLIEAIKELKAEVETLKKG